jgi:hypothetical protein
MSDAFSGSGFYDRSALLEQHRLQRDRLRRHIHRVEQDDRQRQTETSALFIAENVHPFFDQSGLGIPGESPGPHSRPWTQDGRPVSGNVDMPAVTESFDDPYDPELASQYMRDGVFHPNGSPPTPPVRVARTTVDLDFADPNREAQSIVIAMQEILQRDAAAATTDEDEAEERQQVERGIGQYLDSLSRVELHLQQFLARNDSAESELGLLLQRRSVEVDSIRDSIAHLGQRQQSELLLYEWDQQLRMREEKQRHALRQRRRDIKDVATMTTAYLDPAVLPIRIAAPLAELSPDEDDFSVGTPVMERFGDAKPGQRGLGVARAVVAFSARRKSKVERTTSPSDEKYKARAHIARPTDGADEEPKIRNLLAQIPTIPAPAEGRVVFVHVTLKLAEVADALERETSAFFTATVRVTRLILELCSEYHGYVHHMSRMTYSVAFSDDGAALQFAMRVQLDLVERIDWNIPLLRFRSTAAVMDPKYEARTLFKGFRFACGIHAAEIDEKTPWRLRVDVDVLSDRAHYFGLDAGIAAQMADLARGGEVLITREVWASVKTNAPIEVFTTVVAKEFTLRVTPDETRRSNLSLYTDGISAEGFYLLPVVAVTNFEQQSRRLVLGHHPREVVEVEAAVDDDAIAAHPHGGHKDRTPNVPHLAALLPEAPGNRSPAQLYASDATKWLALNSKPLRPSADTSHATFVVITIPQLAALVSVPGGTEAVQTLRTLMHHGLDRINTSKRFFHKGHGAVATAPALDAYDSGGMISQTFDETCLMFKSETLACQFALQLQEELLLQDWPIAVTDFYEKAFPQQHAGDLWCGLRVAAGIATSVPTISRHRSTGLHVYDGVGLGVARELALTAQGGQTLVPHRIVEVISLKGVPECEYTVEVCSNPQKSTNETLVYALYSKTLHGRHEAFGALKPELLVRLLRNLNDIRSNVSAPIKKVTNASLAANQRTDAFLAIAHRMSASHLHFDMAVRAVHSGVIDDKAADVMIALLRQAETQGLADKSLFDDETAGATDDGAASAATDRYSPHLAAQDSMRAPPRLPRKDVVVEEVTIVAKSSSPTNRREVITQTPPMFLATILEPSTMREKDADAGVDGSSEHDDDSTVSAAGHDTTGGLQTTESASHAPSSKRRKLHRTRPTVKTEAELLGEKASKWKELHDRLEERRAQHRETTVPEDVVLQRREQQLQVLIQRKLRVEGKRAKLREAWRRRQDERKNVLRNVIRAKLHDMLAQAHKAREAERLEPWRLTIRVDGGAQPAAVDADSNALLQPCPVPPATSAAPVPRPAPARRTSRANAHAGSTDSIAVSSTSDGNLQSAAPLVASQVVPHVDLPQRSQAPQQARHKALHPSAPIAVRSLSTEPAATEVVMTRSQDLLDISAAPVADGESPAATSAADLSTCAARSGSPPSIAASFLDKVDVAANDLADEAMEQMSLSSLGSSMFGLMDSDNDVNDDDLADVDAGSDVEELLRAAGMTFAAPAGVGQPAAAARKAARVDKHVAKLQREAAKIVRESKAPVAASAAPRRPGKSIAVQCDLGPRIIVKKGEVIQRQGVLVKMSTYGAAERPVPAQMEAARRYDAAEDLEAPATAPKAKVTGFKGGARKRTGDRLTTAGPSHDDRPGNDPALSTALTAPEPRAMQAEISRKHIDDQDEELSFATHLVQRRDLIADFHSVCVKLHKELRHYQTRGAWQFVPTLARKARCLVFDPLLHYLHQLRQHQRGVEREHTEAMLLDVEDYLAAEAERRRKDTALLWQIGLQRHYVDVKSQRAMLTSNMTLRRAQVSLIAAMLKRIAVLKELHSGERQGRMAMLGLALEDLFSARLSALPQVPVAVQFKQFNPAEPAVALIKPINANSARQTRVTTKTHNAALKATGVRNTTAAPALNIRDPAMFASLRQMLLEYEPSLTVMPWSPADATVGPHAVPTRHAATA